MNNFVQMLLFMSETGNRVRHIDTMRGIGILCVVMGHSIGIMGRSINPVILSFHMPLFFFVTGLLYGYRSPDSLEGESVPKHLWKKCRSLLVPLALLWCLLQLKSVCFQLLNCHGVLKPDWLDFGGGWFLIAMFAMDLVLFLTLKISRRSKFCAAGLLAVSVAGFLLCPDLGIKYVRQTLAALIFATMGFLVKPLLDKYEKCCGGIHGIGMMLLPLAAFLAMQNRPVGMYVNEYGNCFLFLVTAFVGIFSVYDISLLVQKSALLNFFGVNSIIVYITHFFVLDLVELLDNCSGLFCLDSLPGGYVLKFLCVLIVEVPVILFVRRCCPQLFGLRPSSSRR